MASNKCVSFIYIFRWQFPINIYATTKSDGLKKNNDYMKESLETGWSFNIPRESTAQRRHCVSMLTHPYTHRAGWPPTVSLNELLNAAESEARWCVILQNQGWCWPDQMVSESPSWPKRTDPWVEGHVQSFFIMITVRAALYVHYCIFAILCVV